MKKIMVEPSKKKLAIKQAAPQLDRSHGLHLLRQMLRIRRLEKKCAELYGAMKIRGFLHLHIGEEAVAVGVNEALQVEDNLGRLWQDQRAVLGGKRDVRPVSGDYKLLSRGWGS